MNENAQGVYFGITATHTRGHFIRAIMEGLAIALRRMLECEQKLGAEMTEIRSLGGGSKSKAWCQIKADILGIPVKVIDNSEKYCMYGMCHSCRGGKWYMEFLWKKLRNSLFQ